MSRNWAWIAVIVVLVCTRGASAHPADSSAGGLVAGLIHPLTGLDHLVAMLAVGLLAAKLGDRFVWLVPSLFLGGLLLGGGLAFASGVNTSTTFVEQLIATSVVVFGSLLVAAERMPRSFLILLVPLFSVFHGFAHIAEHASGVSQYGVGLLVSSTSILLVGLLCGMILERRLGSRSLRLAGGAVAVFGAILLATAL